MKCPTCGAPINPSDHFCAKCGTRIVNESAEMRRCTNCGALLAADITCCPYCGNATDTQEDPGYEVASSDPVQDCCSSNNENLKFIEQLTFMDKVKHFLITKWLDLDLLCKILTALSVFFLILLLIASCVGKIAPISLSVLQLVGLLIIFLMHKDIIQTPRKLWKYVLLFITVLLTVLNIASFSWGQNNHTSSTTTPTNPQVNQIVTNSKTFTPYSSADCNAKHKDILCQDFKKSGFENISEEPLYDLDVSDIEQNNLVTSVTINSLSDFTGNQEFNSNAKIVVYYHSFKKIDIPVTLENALYMEPSALLDLFTNAGFANINADDVFDLAPSQIQHDFENQIEVDGAPIESDHLSFPLDVPIRIVTHKPYDECTITMHATCSQNIMFSTYDIDVDMNGESLDRIPHGEAIDYVCNVPAGTYVFDFVSSEDSSISNSLSLDVTGDINISLSLYCHMDTIDITTNFIEDFGAVGDDEAMLPFSSDGYSDLKKDDVVNSLNSAGFTNIVIEPIYDITDDESVLYIVENILINNEESFTRGDILKNDASIVLSYHEYESEDPVKKELAAKKAALEKIFPSDLAYRAVVVAMTNGQATDVFTADGNSYDPSKFHSYSELDDFFLYTDEYGEWNPADEKSWRVDDMILGIYGYDTYIKVSCEIVQKENNYIVYNVDRTLGGRYSLNSTNPDKVNIEHFEPSDFNSFLTVPSTLISEDRDYWQQEKKLSAKNKHEAWKASQFSILNDSHVELTKLIKQNLNDESSFKHTKTNCIDISNNEIQSEINTVLKESHLNYTVEIGDLIVVEEYTCKNIFNARVKCVAIGLVSYKNNTVTLIANE